MRIIFMGTPQFAVASLDALIKAGSDIVAVVTAPDKPAGRGQKVSESAVKQYAVANGLKVLQPEKLKNENFIAELKALKADLQVVVAFRMLPEAVWNMPAKGTINLHASLLPQYRGAAPINWALINGEKESGVTTFFLKHDIDTGNILFTEKITLTGHEDAGELHDRLMNKGAGLLVKTVKAVESGRYNEHPQAQLAEGTELKHAPKIFKDDCRIDWIQPALSIYNKIRGLSPVPTAYTELNGKSLKVYASEYQLSEPAIQPGGFLTDNKTYLKFAAKDGFVLLKDIQLEGKKRMGIEDFLRGVKL
ncbi:MULTISPECIES: methionyl-tRNA formyltransferase [Mucilaginibacter]|uniref:Methionyl-tRNA formyltransferase n=2 Tax=Mucilaginibacter rubeus TaxID=2027860 RepID=A0ABX7UC90_9SPHI|nr:MULTISPECIES: methionyl-tRNA formyltransferase [Mucilaginibacter]QTE42448.1 methionyl-tRNA formyltransferase [Mucilaginibacter rubeus]QTE49051.1 methionyl-tRNA formyltransferase [Mucilaginibacter rubeus]QTE54149.1 methionyl-tRNA formyltransferase [Mucilaginibacter rubeus]QTE66398.1 methionyl-tRNA formyltransferase [Mucilaginibacter rubeus]QTF65145.1 methionyl-tRNA formyltransferase [Mucilaginibacter rubeus]